MAVELADPRRALEVVPCDLRLPCRDRCFFVKKMRKIEKWRKWPFSNENWSKFCCEKWLSNGTFETKNRWLVLENSFSPAVGSPRRPIKKSLTLTEKFTHSKTRTAIREKPGAFLRRHSQKSTKHSTLIFPAPGTPVHARRAREAKGGGSRGPPARQRKHKRSRKPATPACSRAKPSGVTKLSQRNEALHASGRC